jgi:short-subunit dehydrogenase
MRERGSGAIINVSSLVGKVTFAGMGVYGATKYAVEALSDALRQEVAGLGVKVVIIEPGFVATSLGEAADGRKASDVPGAYAQMVERGERYLSAQLAKGIAPEQVARAIVRAAEDARPRARYAVPGSARLLIGVLTALPDRVADWAKARVTASA